MKVNEDKLPLMFDRFKVFCVITKPNLSDLNWKFPIHKLTSPLFYNTHRRCHTRRLQQNPFKIKEWRANIGYPALEKTQQTLRNTTHYIQTLEGETHEYMQYYHNTCTHILWPRRLNDRIFVDCFFSHIRSIRGFNCFQMHVLKHIKLSITTNLKKEEDAPNAYQYFII